jgi:hypothetical protein
MISLDIITDIANRKLRLVTAAGCLVALGALLAGVVALACKLLFWSSFDAGNAPMVILLCFLGAVQLASLGIIGDYFGAKERTGI